MTQPFIAYVEVEIPEGWEIACNQIRAPKYGEWFIDPSGIHNILRASSDYHINCKYVIVRQVFRWPEWLTANYIAMDESGIWYGYAKKPSKIASSWLPQQSTPYVRLTPNTLTNFVPPECSDWAQSLRRNPNYEGNE